MLDMLQKIPEWAVAPLVVSGLWFGFCYSVLAERAMAQNEASGGGPSCHTSIVQRQEGLTLPRLGLAEKFQMPELGFIEDLARDLHRPALLSAAQVRARCECARMRTQAAAKFDYAVHMATFRIIEPQSVGTLRQQAAELALSGACGPVPGSNWHG